MFKHNYIFKLAFDNIQKKKELYKYISTALLLTFILASLMSVLFSSFEDIGYKERALRYGTWSVAIESPTDEQYNILSDIPIKNKAKIYSVGELNYNDKSLQQLHSFSKDAIELLSFTLTQGRYPQNDNEIIIEENTLTVLGLKQQINQKIKLNLNGKSIDYNIVGIIKDYSEVYPISLGTIFTTNMTNDNYILLINSHDNLKCFNEISSHNYENIMINTSTYSKYIKYDDGYSESDLTPFIQFLIAMIGLGGILGTMISSLKKREENLILMRAIGSTPLQIQKLIIYEGGLLTVIAGSIGTILGLLLSFIVIIIYKQFIGSIFIFSITSLFYIQLIISIIISLIGIFIPSLTVYSIPLTGKVTQKAIKHKSRKIRYFNPIKLAMQEIVDYKLTSLLLIILIIIGIFSGYFSSISIDNYSTTMSTIEKQESYDYVLKNDHGNPIIPQKDINTLTNIEGIDYQIIHSYFTDISWQGIENNSTLITFREDNNDMFKYSDVANIVYYENEQHLKDILNKYNYQGPMLDNFNEAILFKPYFYENDDSGYSISLDAQIDDDNLTFIQDTSLDVGTKINFIKDEDTIAETPLKIVGVFTIDQIEYKDKDLFDYNYLLIVNKQTYDHYFEDDNMQRLIFNVNNMKNISIFQENLIKILHNYPDVYYTNYESQKNIRITEAQEKLYKSIAFVGLMFVGIISLVYIHRKINLMSKKQEFGIYRAIGMTNKQIILKYFIYSLVIYMISLITFLTLYFCIMSNGYTTKQLINYLTSLPLIIIYIVLGILFIFSITLPVRSLFKESILTQITKES